ncbi:replication initiation factor domain-containing protein [Protaetiibacter larvae]|uniref:Replication initiation factor domain-containing protein n=1 Tax=Protaetiibacter larvae TaxID=2592654 RepID=A0A5C1Y8D9_9MICO|nr:replication initiation factor domain-containing protein [Protaetiibacter larvae]QEO10016.1 replication initiation factor domain-containing protein [Protaetiibacter larvae]
MADEVRGGVADRLRAMLSDAAAASVQRFEASFDWYAASIDENPLVVIESLAGWLGADYRRSRGLHGYTAGAEIVRDGNVIARVVYGGNEEAWPHAWASGEDTPPFVAAVRALWPDHGVTRVDAAYDFKTGAPWQRLYDMCVNVADHLPNGDRRGRPLKLATIGDWLREAEGHPDGRTLYIGSMKSPVLARLYEKGKQLRKAFPDQADKYNPGWVRLELQVRPQKQARYDVARLSPEEVWGTALWAKQLHADVFASDLSQVGMGHNRPRDDERAWSFFLRQYGKMLTRRFETEVARLERAGHVVATAEDRDLIWRQIGSDIGRALG